jgi:azurin
MPMRSLAILACLLLPATGFAANCSIDLVSNDGLAFDKKEVSVSAGCETITINLRHEGRLPAASMGHNVVIAQTPHVAALGQEGMKAGVGNQYVPPGDARVIAHTKVIGGGETTSTTFPGNRLTPGGDYTFFCSFPGHWAVMKGSLKVVP